MKGAGGRALRLKPPMCLGLGLDAGTRRERVRSWIA